ncbi:MAG: poly-gamma-glutamate biosynthesis protein PgsC [bacterium]|nr:MAG: poly-gamma-glutamate biosynthesis protein PgsC [bacterium]
MILSAFALGILLGFIFFELSGLTAGGIIVPGYIALYLHEPLRIFATIFIALVTYGIISLLANFMILYGRRRFLMAILVGFLLRGITDWLQVKIPEAGWDLHVIGYIIPGLIANEFFRQGIFKTILALTIVSITVFLILHLFF